MAGYYRTADSLFERPADTNLTQFSRLIETDKAEPVFGTGTQAGNYERSILIQPQKEQESEPQRLVFRVKSVANLQELYYQLATDPGLPMEDKFSVEQEYSSWELPGISFSLQVE